MKIIERVDADESVDCPGRKSGSYGIDFENLPDKSGTGYYCRMMISRLMAAVLLVAFLPVFIVVGVLIKVYDPGPIFYSGARLGYKKTIFYMFKFRTLPVGAQEKIGGEVFRSKRGRLSPLGNFLRDTRMDELPQLMNVLMGDMVFVGPRPVRPEVYRRLCSDIPKYDMRFMMYPGLVGYTQLFTPHGTAKHIRAYINNTLYLHGAGVLKDMQMICCGAWILIRNMLKKSYRVFSEEIIDKRLLNKYEEKRRQPRVNFKDAELGIAPLLGGMGFSKYMPYRGAKYDSSGVLKDISESHFRLWTDAELGNGQYLFRLGVPLSKSGVSRTVRAYCRGEVMMHRAAPSESGFKHEYVIVYEGESALQQYFIDKYFLEMSIA